MKKMYKFFWDCGTKGNVESVFIAEEENVKKLIGKEVYFGEVLGKHSEIYGILKNEDLKIMSEDQGLIVKLENFFGEAIAGLNPLDYIKETDYLEDERDE